MCVVTDGGAVSLDGVPAGPDGASTGWHYSNDVQQIMTDYRKGVSTSSSWEERRETWQRHLDVARSTGSRR